MSLNLHRSTDRHKAIVIGRSTGKSNLNRSIWRYGDLGKQHYGCHPVQLVTTIVTHYLYYVNNTCSFTKDERKLNNYLRLLISSAKMLQHTCDKTECHRTMQNMLYTKDMPL